jgi:nitroimidazol reductase NimA-like FMN-containing flavoprotein (pyridoxamine 5'-phosphate oxidase superfamily)
VLATAGKPYPYTSLIAYTASDDLRNIYFATSKATHKYVYLKNDPHVSFLISTQTNAVHDIQTAYAITVLGGVREIEKDHRPDIAACLVDRFPSLDSFFRDPSSAIMTIDVHLYRVVNDFETVREYSLS